MSELKKGYKMTELGMIPEDWEEKRLGDVLDICHGKNQKSANKSVWCQTEILESIGRHL